MRTLHGMMRRIAKLGLLLMMGASMSACSKSWREEVQLHDGSKIIVERSVDRGGRHEIRQQPPIKEQSLAFNLPTTNERISWNVEFSQDVGLADISPLALDIVQGTAYLVVEPVGCLAYNKWGRPNPPYVVFRYEQKEWKRIPLQELPVEIKMPNLIISSPDNQAESLGKAIISAETIGNLNGRLLHNYPQYRSILREVYPGAAGGCMEEIRTGDGWLSIGGFSSQKSYESCLKVCEREQVTSQNCPCAKLFKGK